MRILKTLILLALLSIPAAIPTRADDVPDPAALKAAQDLFKIMSPDFMGQLMTQMGNAVWPAVEQRAKAHNIDDATLGELRKEFDRIEIENVNLMMQAAPPIYARYFTADELSQLAAFYQTPIGQKAIKVLPQVMGDFFGKIAPMMQTVQSEIEDSFRTILAAHGYKE